MISDALLARYHMPTLAAYIDRHKSAGGFYATFLAQTDYVAAKLAEAAYLGQTPRGRKPGKKSIECKLKTELKRDAEMMGKKRKGC